MTAAAKETESSRGTFAGHAPHAARFAGVGVFNTGLDFLVFIALQTAAAPALFANGAAFLCANGASYALNARFTFGADVSFGGYGRFLSVHVASLVVSTVCIAAFEGLIGALAAKAVAAALALSWNYAGSALFAFRKSGGQ